MVFRILFGALLMILVGAILWAAGLANIMTSLSAMIADPWGLVTLIDLYSGFIAMAAIIGLVEGPVIGGIALVFLAGLGNVVTLAWLVFRGWTLLIRLKNRINFHER